MLLTVAANLSAFAFQVEAPPEINESLPAANDAPAANNSANQTSGNQASANRIAIELRVVWGGGAPRAFQGNISIDNGSIKLVRNLSLQSDSIGSIVSAGTSTLKVIGHSASTFGGADVSIEGGPTSRVTLRFVHPTTNQPIEHSFLVNEVLNDRWLRKLDEQGNRLAAERQVQDRLRVRSSQPQGIFHPDYVWTGSVSGYLSGLQAGEYQLQTRLLDQNAGDAVVSEQEQAVTVDERGDFNTSSLQVPLPHTESSYALEFSLHRKRFLQTFVSSPQVLKRRLDLVVFDYALPPKRIEYWSPVATIQPLNSQWWSSMDWMPTLGAAQPLVQIPSFNEHNKRLVNHGPQSSRKVGEDDCLVLGPSAWQAYPLTIEHPGQPHRLRIRLPRDQAQQLIISIRDSHSNGEPTTLNIDSGVVIGERQAFLQSTNSAGGSPWIWADHEIVFWPRSSRPTLLMLNGSSTEEAAFGDLQLDVGQIQAKQPATPAQNELNTTDAHTSERMVALYLTKPLIADAFGAHRSIDPVTKRALDSWLTWQQSAERLSLHMQNAGYNTLILNVAGDGGSVLPLSRLASTTRFDNGTFFSDGRSPEIKDFVELLCRHFDRAGLKLILAVDLNAHLPGLARWEAEEAKRVELQKADSQKASPQNSESKNSELKAAGLFQVNLDGKPWQLDSDSSNRRVLYNPLHSQVQTEIEQIVRELSTRYSSHQSFKGLALDLGEASHLVFAGDRWGYDESTLKKFESATQSRLPAREAMPAAMQGGLRLAYLNWRARALSTFYVRLADTLRNAKPDAKLLLNPISLWQRQPSQHEYMDSLATSRNLSDTLLCAGVDVGWLKQHEHIAVLRGQFESALGSDLERAWLSRAANDPGMVYASLGNTGGTVQLQRPVGLMIPEANKLQNLASQGNNAVTTPAAWCYPVAASLGPQVRKSFIEQLYREDSLLVADGTWMPTQGDSLQLATFRKTFVELPNIPMQTVKIDRDDSNVRLRSVRVGNDTYLQLINNASWTEHVTMDVKIADIPGVYEVLGGKDLQINGAASSSSASSRIDKNGSRASTIWQFDLPPYELIAFKVSDPQFKLNSFIHSPETSLVDGMKREIDALENMMSLISDNARAESLDVPGGDFEKWIEGVRPLGWTVSSLPQVAIRQEKSLPHSGSSCVLIENNNQSQVSAWIQSEKIRIPESGRLVVNAWVRAPSAGTKPQVLRLSLIGRTHDGRRYQRSHQFGTQPAGAELAIDWGKRPVTLYVTDLPSAELAELYVAFDLVGPGKVWVDDIQAQEAYLSPDERIQIRGQIFLAKEKLRDNNAFPAEQVLNSHLARYLASIKTKSTMQTAANEQQPINGQPFVEPEKQTPGSRWNNSPPILQQLRESMRERWQK